MNYQYEIDKVDLATHRYSESDVPNVRENESKRSKRRSLNLFFTVGGIVSKETVCCVGGKVKH